MKLIKDIPDAHAMIAYEGNDGKLIIDMTRGFAEKFKKTSIQGEDNVRWHVVAPD
jgi:hypothetical protein